MYTLKKVANTCTLLYCHLLFFNPHLLSASHKKLTCTALLTQETVVARRPMPVMAVRPNPMNYGSSRCKRFLSCLQRPVVCGEGKTKGNRQTKRQRFGFMQCHPKSHLSFPVLITILSPISTTLAITTCYL